MAGGGHHRLRFPQPRHPPAGRSGRGTGDERDLCGLHRAKRQDFTSRRPRGETRGSGELPGRRGEPVVAFADPPCCRQPACGAWRKALVEIIACFPVYRSYIRPGRAPFTMTTGAGSRRPPLWRAKRPASARRAVERIRRVLRRRDGRTRRRSSSRDSNNSPARPWRRASRIARSIATTGWWRSTRWAAIRRGSASRWKRFTATASNRCALRPDSMLASSTHDTKRGEDVRARLCLLSEMPGAVGGRRSRLVGHERWPARGTVAGPQRGVFVLSDAGRRMAARPRPRAGLHGKGRAGSRCRARPGPDIDPGYEEALRDFVNACFANERFMAAVEAFVGPLLDPGRGQFARA